MTTELQRRFKTSGIKRMFGGCILEMLADEGISTRRRKRLCNEMAAELFSQMSEAQIKYILLELLQCYDIDPETAAEAIRLLQMSETALTTEQQQQIENALNE